MNTRKLWGEDLLEIIKFFTGIAIIVFAVAYVISMW